MIMKESIILLTIIGFISLSDCYRYEAPGTQVQPAAQPEPHLGASCTTPKGKAGICNYLLDCSSHINLLKYIIDVPGFIEYLRMSLCGYHNDEPLVCCVDDWAQMEGSMVTEKPRNDPYPKMPSPTCGISNAIQSRIIGGARSTLGAWPWMAALGFFIIKDGKLGQFITYRCGGSLVSNQHVITAAHCTNYPTLYLNEVRLGDLDLNNTVDDGASPIDIMIERVLAHPAYDGKKLVNDIAILYLKEKVQFNRFISPICLPNMNQVRMQNFVGTTPTVIGWGAVFTSGGRKSTHLLEVEVTVMTVEDCRKAYSAWNLNMTSKEICAGSKKGGMDTCSGDSGGPLMYYSKGTYYLIGVAAFGFGCGNPKYPGVYTRTTEYLEWINENLV